MQDKQNEDAKWDDIDWGAVESDPAAAMPVVSVPTASAASNPAASTPVTPPQSVAPPPLPAEPRLPSTGEQQAVPTPPVMPSRPPELPQNPIERRPQPLRRPLVDLGSLAKNAAPAPVPKLPAWSTQQPPSPNERRPPPVRKPAVDLGSLAKKAVLPMPKNPLHAPEQPPTADDFLPQPAREQSSKNPPGPYIFAPTTEATLTLSQRDGQEELVITVKDQFTVGRHANNDLVIKDLYVSTHHARFVGLRDGTFEVVDLHSSGGTFVNGSRVDRQALKSGDEVAFATVKAVFRYVAGRCLDDEMQYQCTMMHQKADAPNKFSPPGRVQTRATLIMPDGVRSALPLAGKISVGRSPDNDIVINEGHVSNLHANLVGSGGGAFEVFDLNSTCGTFLNDTPVKTGTLSNGDRIRFGIVECLLEIA